MRKLHLVITLSLLIFALSCSASAADFELDDKAVITGMDGRSWYQGYTPSVRYGNFAICLPLRSERASGAITASIALDDPDLLLFRSQPGALRFSPNDGLYPVVLNIPLSQNRRNGDYATKILISGKTENGEPVTEAFPYIIRIRDGDSNPEALVPIMNISGDLNVGEDCILNLTIQNPTKSLSMTDCELTLTDASGEILMSGSNRMALPEILPGQTAEIEVPVTVKGNAAVEPHSLSLKLTYQVLGEDKTWEETITHPVTQEIRLEQGGITMPSSAIQGELTTLSVPLMNLGKGDICNAMVSLDIPELIPRQSVLVGTIEPGATGQAKLTFTPAKDALGDYSGMVTISCEDPYGNSQQRQIPVEITIEAARPAENDKMEEKKAEAPGWLLPAVSVLCVLLLAGILLQGMLLRAKLHRLEEELL